MISNGCIVWEGVSTTIPARRVMVTAGNYYEKKINLTRVG
jgi:hypothetical protein